ncbi:MAG: caspase family protein [Pseudomonadota bacterium]
MKAVFAILALLLAFVQPAQAERRLALVIGNGAYDSLGDLANPAADARLMSDALESIGFEVTVLRDADEAAMKRGIVRFGRSLRAAGEDAVGLFYFAGHGVQAYGANYLLPTGIDAQDEADLEIGGVKADWVLRQMESAGNAINIVILDACRNNPFAGSFRSPERGLARMDAPRGSFIAYATAPGAVAVDGTAGNSPYTAAIARALTVPNLPIEQLFKQVRVDVIEATSGAQTPWDSSSLTRDFAFNTAAPALPELAEAVARGAIRAGSPEYRLWRLVEGSAEADHLRLFLDIFPASPLRTEALARIETLEPTVVASAPAHSLTRSAAPPPGTLSLSLTNNHTTWTLCAQRDLVAPLPVPQEEGAWQNVRMTDGSRAEMRLSRTDGGARLFVRPYPDLSASAVMAVDLDGLEPGTKAVLHSRLAWQPLPCGRITAFVTIEEPQE